MKRFLNRIDQALLGSVTLCVTFALGFLWWIYQPSDSVPMWLFSACFVVFYAVCIVIYAACSREVSVVYRLPQVRAIERESSRLVFLLEKNDLFSTNTLVTISYQNEDVEIETILGLGRVEAINTQGCAQVVFYRESSAARAQSLIAGLSNTKRDRVALRFKPSVTTDLINGGFVEEYEDAEYYD